VITKLKLKNWRSYVDADLTFCRGTTFVVASNGVGKTSLIEAARWALFASRPAADPVRVGADGATVHLELALPDGRVLGVTRPIKSARGRAPQPTLTLDGQEQPVDRLEVILTHAYGCTPAFLEGVVMPAARDEAASPSDIGLREHLSSLYGIQGLDEAVVRLDALIRESDSEIRAVKVQRRDAQVDRARLRQEAASLAARAGESEGRLEEAGRALKVARKWSGHRAALEQWKAASAAVAEAAASATAKAESFLANAYEAGTGLQDRLAGALEETNRDLEAARVDRRVAETSVDAVRGNLGRLGEAGHDCPVCRRPLDENTVSLAHEAAQNDLAGLAATIQSAKDRESALATRQRALEDLLRAWHRLPVTPEPPVEPEGGASEGPSLDEAESAHRCAIERSALARDAAQKAAEALRAADDEEERQLELESLFARDVRLRMAKETTVQSRDDLLTRTIEPLAGQIDATWAALFPRRGQVNTRADGAVTRTVSGHDLSYEQFSTAEQAGALLVLRLLVATMTTSADFVWFDEPLEHLDPDVRRHVANLLSRVTLDGPLRQVVVTTYEEPLARKLAERDPERVALQDVRPDPIPPGGSSY